MSRRKRATEPDRGVLGRQLRALRHERGLRLVDLGAATGLSHAFLSQIESGTANPSLTTLWSIAGALGVEPGALLQETPSHEPLVVRGGTGRVVAETETEPRAVVRAHSEAHHLRATIAEGPIRTTEPATQPGEQFVYVVAGTLEITLGDTKHLLERGDSIVFDGSVPHGYQTVGDDARILFVFTQHDDAGRQGQEGGASWFRRLVGPAGAILSAR